MRVSTFSCKVRILARNINRLVRGNKGKTKEVGFEKNNKGLRRRGGQWPEAGVSGMCRSTSRKSFGRKMPNQNGAKKEKKTKSRSGCRYSSRVKRSGFRRRRASRSCVRRYRERENRMLKATFPLRERWPKNGLLRRVALCLAKKLKRRQNK